MNMCLVPGTNDIDYRAIDSKGRLILEESTKTFLPPEIVETIKQVAPETVRVVMREYCDSGAVRHYDVAINQKEPGGPDQWITYVRREPDHAKEYA